MTTDFASLLNRQVDSVEPPKRFPIGPYDAVIVDHECGESSNKGTPYVRFNVKLLSPREGVDMDEFEEAGGMEKLNDRKPIRFDFYLTDDAYYRLRQFLENGLGLQASGRTFDQVLPETKSAPFIAQIAHRKGNREGELFMEIGDYAMTE